VVSVAMDSRGRDEAGDPLEELERREQELGAAVGGRLGQPIDESGVGRGEGNDAAGGMEPFQSEGWTSTVSEQPFDARAVLALDADGRVDAEATGSLPGQHAVGVGFVKQAMAMEVAQDTALDNVLELGPVPGSELGGLMEAHVAVIGRREHAIEYDEVEMEVWIECGAEPMLVRMSECRIPLVLTTDRYTAWWIQHRLRRTRKEFAADQLEKTCA